MRAWITTEGIDAMSQILRAAVQKDGAGRNAAPSVVSPAAGENHACAN